MDGPTSNFRDVWWFLSFYINFNRTLWKQKVDSLVRRCVMRRLIRALICFKKQIYDKYTDFDMVVFISHPLQPSTPISALDSHIHDAVQIRCFFYFAPNKVEWICVVFLSRKPYPLLSTCSNQETSRHYWITAEWNESIWAVTWDFQQCDMCDQQSLRSACAYTQSDQSLC